MIQSFFKIPVVVPRNTPDHTGIKVDQDSLYRAYVGLVPSLFQRWNGGPRYMTAKFSFNNVLSVGCFLSSARCGSVLGLGLACFLGSGFLHRSQKTCRVSRIRLRRKAWLQDT